MSYLPAKEHNTVKYRTKIKAPTFSNISTICWPCEYCGGCEFGGFHVNISGRPQLRYMDSLVLQLKFGKAIFQLSSCMAAKSQRLSIAHDIFGLQPFHNKSFSQSQAKHTVCACELTLETQRDHRRNRQVKTLKILTEMSN